MAMIWNEDGNEKIAAKIGDIIGFKSDIEQSGKIAEIDGDFLMLNIWDDLSGEYYRYGIAAQYCSLEYREQSNPLAIPQAAKSEGNEMQNYDDLSQKIMEFIARETMEASCASEYADLLADNPGASSARDIAAACGISASKARKALKALGIHGEKIEGQAAMAYALGEGHIRALMGQGESESESESESDFAALFRAYGGYEARGICRALRRIARQWEGKRKSFLAEAAAIDLNVNNAAAEWQAGRKQA